MMKWIKPEERLPKTEEVVLITVKEGALTVNGYIGCNEVLPAFFVNDSEADGNVDGLWYPHFYEWQSNHIFENKDVVAWMPFPEPYTEEA